MLQLQPDVSAFWAHADVPAISPAIKQLVNIFLILSSSLRPLNQGDCGAACYYVSTVKASTIVFKMNARKDGKFTLLILSNAPPAVYRQLKLFS